MGCCSQIDSESSSEDSINECTYTKSGTCCEETPVKTNLWGCCSGFHSYCMGLMAFLLFTSVTIVTGIYLSEYHKGFAWREYENKEQISKTISTHALLTVAGFITLGGLGIVFFRISECCGIAAMKVLHFMFLLSAGTLVFLGFFLTYELHDKKKVKHFQSVHGLVGIFAIALMGLEIGCGVLKFLILLICGPLSCCLRTSCIPIHAALGIAACWSAIATIIVALQKDILRGGILPTRRKIRNRKKDQGKLQLLLQFGKDYLQPDLEDIDYAPNIDTPAIPFLTTEMSVDFAKNKTGNNSGKRRFPTHNREIFGRKSNKTTKGDVFTMADTANAISYLLVACGILLTYLVISRMIRRFHRL